MRRDGPGATIFGVKRVRLRSLDLLVIGTLVAVLVTCVVGIVLIWSSTRVP